MADDELRASIEQVYDYLQALIDESDRGAAILAAAHFEDWLRKRITSRFVEPNGNLIKILFERYGPLSSFSAKIDIANALGLYDEETRICLHVVRKIRNKFAHASKPAQFNNKDIAELCRKLPPSTTPNSQDLRERYMNYLSLVQDDIRSSGLPLIS